MLLSVDRFDTIVNVVDTALNNAEHDDWELLVWRNGGTDDRVAEYLRSLQTSYLRLYESNLGLPQALNQLMLRATGDYFYQMDDDVLLPRGWMRAHVEANQAIPNSGLSAIHCVQGLPKEEVINGIKVHPADEVWGNTFFSRKVFEKIGFFTEELGKYGGNDHIQCVQARAAGFQNYYLGGLEAKHLIEDVGEDTPYRRSKQAEIEKHYHRYQGVIDGILGSERSYYMPAPEMI